MRGRQNTNPTLNFIQILDEIIYYYIMNRKTHQHDVDMTLFVGLIFYQEKNGYLMRTTSRSWMNFCLWKNIMPS
jgi:hypothetical protein